MRQTILCFSLLLLAPLASFAAQDVPSLAPGARVRVTTLEHHPEISHLFTDVKIRHTGTLIALNADTLLLKPDGQSSPRMIPLAHVTGLDMSRGWASRGERATMGSGIGFLVGGVILAIAGGTALEENSGSPGARMILFMIGGVPGAAIGAVVGESTAGERWEQVPLERIRVSVAPQRHGGVRLAASFIF
jgi:hypothetical protein